MLRGTFPSFRFVLATAAGVVTWSSTGAPSLAEAVSSRVVDFDLARREVTIDAGSSAGVSVGDRGTVVLPAPPGDTRVGMTAAVAVLRVTPDFAIVEVRESERALKTIVRGLTVTIDTQTGAEIEADSAPPLPAVSAGAPQSLRCPPQSLPETATSDLPADYLEAYAAARTQPSPQTYYTFAKTLIDYELADEALLWLEETERCFPETRSIGQLYRAVALIQQDRLIEAEAALSRADRTTSGPVFTEVEGYLLTQKGDWEQAIALLEDESSDVNVSNFLIAQYCSNPPELERKSDVPPTPCPFGSASASAAEPTDEGREELERLLVQVSSEPTENAHLLNTLGFLALQTENYDLAYESYTQLVELVEDRDFASPGTIALKDNADTYTRNYDQNYEFLEQRQQNLALLRSGRRSIAAVSTVAAVANVAGRRGGRVSTQSLVGTGLFALFRVLGANRESKRLKKERIALLDTVRQTFLADVTLVTAQPDLDPARLLRGNDVVGGDLPTADRPATPDFSQSNS